MKEFKKNILISAPFGYSVKNLLFSSFWDSEVVKNSRIYILTPIPEVYENFLKKKKITNIVLIKINFKTINFSKFFELIWEINKVRFLDKTRSNTQRIRWQQLKENSYFVYSIKRAIITISKIFSNRQLEKLLFKLAPEIEISIPKDLDIWLSMAPSFKEDLLVHKQLIKNNVSCNRIAFMHSWDNFSSKGPLVCVYDKILIWGEAMQNEMSQKDASLADKLQAIGMPQYDILQDDLKRKFKRATDEKYILYTTGHPNTIPNEPLYVADILKTIEAEQLNLTMIVRVHPNDKIDRYSHLADRYPYLQIEDPGVRTQDTYDKWSPEENDMLHYGSLIKNAEAIINIASTVSLDASFYEKPVICLNYDKKESSIKKFYGYDHYHTLLSYGGLYLCNERKNLGILLKSVLRNHRLKDEQRKMFSCYDEFKDGQSGKRLGDQLK